MLFTQRESQDLTIHLSAASRGSAFSSAGSNADRDNANSSEESRNRRTILERLYLVDPGVLINLLNNLLTAQKRALCFRQRCTPSRRLKVCAVHCSQILVARVLVVMTHSPVVQHRIVADGHLRTLVDALDPNYDPVSGAFVDEE